MAAVNPPWACQGRTDHPAVLVRNAIAVSLHGRGSVNNTTAAGGVHADYGNRLAVTGLASMNVQVDTGTCVMPSSTSWAGVYYGYNSAAFNRSIAAASSTQWRTDRVDAVVTDPGDNTANWDAIVTTGAFSSSSPGATPAAPANSIPLALIRVVPNMTVTNGGGTVLDNRQFLPLGGPIITTSANKPTSTLYQDGTMWYETDTDQLGILQNGVQKYILIGDPPDTLHTSTSLINGWSGTVQYTKNQDGMVDAWVSLNSPIGTDNTGFWNIPSGYQVSGSNAVLLGFKTILFTGTPGTPTGTWIQVQPTVLDIFGASGTVSTTILGHCRWPST